MIATYTVTETASNGRIVHKELVNREELEILVNNAYGKWSNMTVANDVTGEVRKFKDDGEKWVRVA